MRGKNVFMESLIGHGISHIFGNPGTTESPILDALLDYPQLRYIVALHEGVALGAASYYAQATGKVGVVNVHVAPGLGNALGMLYNALKARAPLVVTAGQQDTRLRLGSRQPVIVAGDDAARATAEVAGLAERLGAAVWCEGIRTYQVLPSRHSNFRGALPFDTVAIRKALEGSDVVLLVGGPFFEEVWYAPGSPLPPGARVIHVESSAERLAANWPVSVGLVSDPRAALSALLAAVDRDGGASLREAAARRNDALKALKAQEAEA